MPDRTPSTRPRTFRAAAALAAGAALAAAAGLGLQAGGCGYGTGGVPSASIEPRRATVRVGGAETFEARLTEIGYREITWEVREGDRGGTVTPRAAVPGVPPSFGDYAAPATPGVFRVRCTVNPGEEDQRVLEAEVRAAPPCPARACLVSV